QGQSLKQVGIDLSTSVFARGQLYVTLSRATSPLRIEIVFPEDESEHTANVIYELIFN
ncbi:helicase, partial [Russula brevipes]